MRSSRLRWADLIRHHTLPADARRPDPGRAGRAAALCGPSRRRAYPRCGVFGTMWIALTEQWLKAAI